MNCVASAVDNPAAVYRVQNECFLVRGGFGCSVPDGVLCRYYVLLLEDGCQSGQEVEFLKPYVRTSVTCSYNTHSDTSVCWFDSRRS